LGAWAKVREGARVEQVGRRSCRKNEKKPPIRVAF
jgi:hypothetical protein